MRRNGDGSAAATAVRFPGHLEVGRMPDDTEHLLGNAGRRRALPALARMSGTEHAGAPPRCHRGGRARGPGCRSRLRGMQTLRSRCTRRARRSPRMCAPGARAHVHFLGAERSERMRARLAGAGMAVPAGQSCPAGAQLLDSLLEPVARLAPVASRIRLGHRVVGVACAGLLKHEQIWHARPCRCRLPVPDRHSGRGTRRARPGRARLYRHLRHPNQLVTAASRR